MKIAMAIDRNFTTKTFKSSQGKQTQRWKERERERER